MNSGIRFTRHPYEEPYHLNLHLEAFNERCKGSLEFYCGTDQLRQFGSQLTDLTIRNAEDVAFELGSLRPEDRFGFFLALRAKPLNSRGDRALLVHMNNNQESPDREVAEFSILTTVAALNRLGDLLIDFCSLQDHLLTWNADSTGNSPA